MDTMGSSGCRGAPIPTIPSGAASLTAVSGNMVVVLTKQSTSAADRLRDFFSFQSGAFFRKNFIGSRGPRILKYLKFFVCDASREFKMLFVASGPM